MDVSAFLSEASFWVSDHAAKPLVHSAFHPVARWLVDAARPRVIAQLGFERPSVYFALCETVERLGLATSCVAVEPLTTAPPDNVRLNAASRRARETHARAFGTFSTLARVPIEEIIESFPDRSIDLIHPSDPGGVARFQRDLDAWRTKFSERAILLLPQTNIPGREGGSRDFHDDLARRHPSFEFTHGDGFGLIALGEAPPERVRALFDADGIPELRDAIRLAYARLGHGLAEAPALEAETRLETSDHGPTILDIGKSNGAANLHGASSIADEMPNRDGDDSASGFGSGASKTDVEELVLREENELLREDNERLRERIDRLDQSRRDLSRENATLRRENPLLQERLAHSQHDHALAVERLNELRRSTTLVLVEKGRKFRGRYFPQTRLHGRCLELVVRFARVSFQVGPRAAVGKAARRVLRKAGIAPRPVAPPSSMVPEPVPVYRSIVPTNGAPRFEDLPWSYTGSRPRDGARQRPTLKILLVSHASCRTGAPLCLLRLSEELSKIPDVECWTVLKNGGELSSQFARHAPTLDLSALAACGVARPDAPGEIASRFRDFSRKGVAICNTMAVSEFHEAFGAQGVPVLSWIHELPTFIDILGGREAIERIKRASHRTIVPANVVREALIAKFDFDPSRIQTLYYGLDAKTRGLSRETMRARVREELGLPEDARIVLGCGTIDLRKGADLFAQMGRTFLLETAPADLASRTFFLWIGHPVDQDLRKWLLHDIEKAGLSDRIRFLGTRDDMPPYFLGADVFALTSREDPCPFANLEAMESSLAVVAFQGGGGAPEVLGDGGIAAPYLDVKAMAEAARDLLSDDAKRLAMGERGRAAIRGHFTWPRFMAEFREVLEADYGLEPSKESTVSVIVPNYRHAPYLEARLRSIFEQTVPPREIIFLDDASPDDSVEIARRLALESPVPMRVVVNERNSGSTFRQWMKGFDLAEGDLIWIAESDDCAHPEFLERMLPEFHDRDVVLAYSQSALIGSEGRVLVKNFLAHTDDLSPARWRSRYSATCREEAEIALSQKNTIPNASAVIFRRCDEMDYAEELLGMRFAGDWLFYAMRIRGGKIAFVPEVLNYYRRHENTVSYQSCKADTHVEETLHVKIRVFETFSVSANAIRRGLGQTFLEYAMLTVRFSLKRPPLTMDARAGMLRLLDRARGALNRQTGGHGELKILFIVDSAQGGLDRLASIHLINALARDHQVFLCVASPAVASETSWEELDDRVIPIEGTLAVTPWSSQGFEGRFRAEVLKELIRFHQIDVIHSRFEEGDRLAAKINAELNLPWFIHMSDGSECWLADEADPSRDEALATVSGVFHEASDPSRLAERRPELAGKRWLRLFEGLRQDALPRPAGSIRKREGEFWVYLVSDDARLASDANAATAAVRLVNRLSAVERGGRRVRLVMADGAGSSSPGAAPLTFSVPRAADELDLIAQCDVAIAPHAGDACRVSSRVAALLAHNIPIIAPDKGAIHDMLSSTASGAGLEVESDGRPTLSADRMAVALLRYLKRPDLLAAHRDRAGRLFDGRFRVDQSQAVCEEAYLHARDFLVFARPARPGLSIESRTPREIASRESA